MSIIRRHNRLAAASAIAVLFVIPPVIAGPQSDKNKSVEIAFTKWVTTSPPWQGSPNGDANVAFVGHIFERLVSADGHLVRLEAMYEVQDGDRSFTALLTGASSATGLGLLDGVILKRLAHWRQGACGVSGGQPALTHGIGLRGGTSRQNVFRGNDFRRARSIDDRQQAARISVAVSRGCWVASV